VIYCNETKFEQKHKILTSRIMLYVLGHFFPSCGKCEAIMFKSNISIVESHLCFSQHGGNKILDIVYPHCIDWLKFLMIHSKQT
jgi:hypothetical protein